MHLRTDWTELHLGLMKDLNDLEGIIEVEVDTKVDVLVEEDHLVATIVMIKDTWQETFHF
jgi:hypothetical protein